jgi:hypothetical protein
MVDVQRRGVRHVRGKLTRMETKRAPVIPYYRRSERLTLRELWAKAPRRFTLVACLIGNLAVCIGASVFIGGMSLGTTPSSQGYVVTDHGHYTPVTHRVWLFMLFYPSATLLITTIGIALVIATLIRGIFGERRLIARAALAMSLIVALWVYAIARNTCFSALDDWGLHRIWPVMAWLLRASVLGMVAVLIFAARRERKNEEREWLVKEGHKLIPQPIVRRA